MSRPSPQPEPADDLLANPNRLLSRSDLQTLGLGRRAVDAVYRACPVVVLPGYGRALIAVRDYVAFIEQNTYRDDRVRPAA